MSTKQHAQVFDLLDGSHVGAIKGPNQEKE